MRLRLFRNISLAALIAAGSMAAVAAQAQDGPGGPPPPDGGGPGGPPPFGGPGGFRGGPMGPPRDVTAAMVPLDTLDSYLGLSDDQHSRIQAIVDTLRRERPRPPMPPRGGQDGGEPPPRPSQEEMQAMRAKTDAAMKKADAAIDAVLDSGQKAKLKPLVLAMTALQADRVPPGAAGKLKLTDDQVARLARLGSQAKGSDVSAILTPEQRQIVGANHMQRRGGGPGGPPPPDGGGPGGPPPGGPDTQ